MPKATRSDATTSGTDRLVDFSFLENLGSTARPGTMRSAFVARGDLHVNRWDVITTAFARPFSCELRLDPRLGDGFVQLPFPRQLKTNTSQFRDQLRPRLRIDWSDWPK